LADKSRITTQEKRMHSRPKRILLGPVMCVLALAATQGAGAESPGSSERLAFDVNEGLNLNSFLRAGPVAAHLLLRSGADPRILVAFPAGNSGVGLWFAPAAQPVTWTLQAAPQPVSDHDAQGRPLYGIRAFVVANAPELIVKRAVLSSIRVLRDFQTLGTAPDALNASQVVAGQQVTWARDRLDGAAGYLLRLEITAGTLRDGRITAGADGRIALQITALSGETPLTPLGGAELFNASVKADPGAQNALTFLCYREKFLAGSWRFDTYFGRDTLMSVRLLMPVLTPQAIESALGAVLARLSSKGEVAHEEDIGEFSVLEHLRANATRSDAPIFDYRMIDGNFMLAPVLTAWLQDDARGRERAAAFLARMDGRYGEPPRTMGADLVTNLRLVLQSADPFAHDPVASHLISLKDGMDAGQWRDSGEGLGRGRFPYDVNAVFVPAALAAAARFFRSGLLDPYLAAADRPLFARASQMAAVWNRKVSALFDVHVPRAAAVHAVEAYAARLGVPAGAARDAIAGDGVRFHALALDGKARPVPVVHSDEGFELLFGQPGAIALDEALITLMRPFPAGLRTDAGIVVANPVYADAATQERFGKGAYHGTVIWSWQQAVLAAGLARQLRRHDLPAALMRRVEDAQAKLWRVIDAGQAVRNSELWSWDYRDGSYRVAPFGASQGDVDESNAAQLWSTVYLALPEPALRAH
jgi:hypothetical protein